LAGNTPLFTANFSCHVPKLRVKLGQNLVRHSKI
jgi:hypothetical protein